MTLRVYRGDPNPLKIGPDVPIENYLRPPAIDKNFLISPPGSPPVGWEQVLEDPPNATPLAADLITALTKLSIQYEARSGVEMLLEPDGDDGVSVFVQDCDADGYSETGPDESEWIYGQASPARTKWKPMATAMPPLPAFA